MIRTLTLLFTAAATLAAQSISRVNEAESAKLFGPNAKVEKIAGGLMFTEGPVWINAEGGYLVFSDIPANELKRWDAKGGVKTFRANSGQANGNTLDLQGRLVTAEHSGRVSRTEKNGTVVALAERVDGKRLSSPNDVVVKSDGSIWFTDPDYGLGQRTKETLGNYVYRIAPNGTTITTVVTHMERPNGLCFSPDERILYVADAGRPVQIRAFAVNANGTLSNSRAFVTLDNGAPDGIRCDQAGRVWSSSGDGVQVFLPNGVRVARILLPESAANLAWGGPTGRTLYMTARTSLFAVDTLVTAARRGAGGQPTK